MVEYTKIPDEYLGEKYEYLISLDRVKKEYGGDILKACEDDPALFGYIMLGFKPRDYQLYHLHRMRDNRFVFSLMGRRMGKSTDFKIFDAWALWWNKYPQGREKTTKILVLAHTSDSAESYIQELRDIYDVGDKRVEQVFKGKLGKRYFTSKFPKKTDNAKINNSELNVYNNGWNKIMAFPPTARARGRAASIVQLDELAFWDEYANDEYKIYKEVVRPIVTDSPGSKIFIATTPNGPSGLAYDLLPVDNHKTQFELIWYPFYYRKDEEYLEEMKKVREEYDANGDFDSFRQEYLAELVSKGKLYFQKEKEIDKVFDLPDMSMATSYFGECHAAIDFGGSKISRTVITVSRFNKEFNRVERLYHKRYPVGKDSTLKEDILDVYKRFPGIQKWHVDSQGGGSSFYDWFKGRFGSHMVHEVTFRGLKADMFRLFKIACFKGRIKSYYDPELSEEFLNFTSDLKPAKHATDDMLDSFVMSAFDWLEEKSKSKYIVVRY